MNRPESYSRRLFRTIFNSRLRLASSRAIELQDRVENLEKDVQQLSLLSLALMTLLEEQGSVSSPDLDQMMEAVDAADGSIDGKVDIAEYMARLRARIPAPRSKHKPIPPPGEPSVRPLKQRTLPKKPLPRRRKSQF
ncbi:MAG: hypothetical protein P1V97_24730 [Planctomycetota bacterium]|nr:hypothetical protein [Planctomycetota bacterium]